jgi:hypothetical protein
MTAREAVMEIACMAKGFLPYSLDPRLLPPDMRAWLATGTWRFSSATS